MPTPKFKPNGKGDPRSGRDRKREALARLKSQWEKDNPDEQWEPEKEPIITPMLKAVGIDRVVSALAMHNDEDARAFMEVYERFNATDARLVPIETIAFAAGIGSLRLAEISQTALYLYREMKTNMLMDAHLPEIVEKSLKMAKTAKGFSDREWMLKSGKILPIPRGSQTAIQNNFNSEKSEQESSAPAAWKSSEERLREFQTMTESEPRRLPAPESKPMTLGGHVDHMQAETVEILRGDQ